MTRAAPGRTVVVSVRLTKTMIAELKQRAVEEERTVCSMIRVFLRRSLATGKDRKP